MSDLLTALEADSRAFYPGPRSERLAKVASSVRELLSALEAFKACRESSPETVADSMTLCLDEMVTWERVAKAVSALSEDQLPRDSDR